MVWTLIENGAIDAAIQGIGLAYFCDHFLEPRFAFGKKNSSLCSSRKRTGWITAVVWIILKMILSHFWETDFQEIQIFLKLLVTMILLFLVVGCFYQADRYYHIFVTITYMAIGEICFMTAYLVLRLSNGLIEFWIWCLEKGWITSAQDFLILVEGTADGMLFLMYVVYALLLFVSLKRMIKSDRENGYHMQRTELVFIITPGLAGLLICALLRVIMITVQDGVPYLLYDHFPILLVLVPAIMILSLLAILFSFQVFQSLITWNREKNEKIILRQQVERLQEQIEQTERIYANVRSIKHEIKNQIAVIRQLSESGGASAKKEMQSYLVQMNRTMEQMEFPFHTGNTIADTVLGMKYTEALDKIPELEFYTEAVLFPPEFHIQSYDLAMILCNAIDNAIEACEKLRGQGSKTGLFIRVSSYTRGKMFFLEIENSFHGTLMRQKNAEFPKTDKADREAHGIGLINIRQAAEKYHGAVEWSVERQVFTLSVMMQNEPRKEI